MICHLAPSGIWSQSADAALAERRPVRAVERHLEGPRDALGVHEVADEAGHGHAAVLELGLAQEADGRRVRLVEELLERELEGVEVTNNRVLFVGEGLEAREVEAARRLGGRDRVLAVAGARLLRGRGRLLLGVDPERGALRRRRDERRG